MTRHSVRFPFHAFLAALIVTVGASIPASAEETTRRMPDAQPSGPLKITVTTTTIDPRLVANDRTVTTEVIYTDADGRSRVDRGNISIIRNPDETAPRVVNRVTGEWMSQDTRAEGAQEGAKVSIGREVKREDLGERGINGMPARGTRVTWEMPGFVSDAPTWEVSAETWKTSEGRVLEKTTWDSQTERTQIIEYAYEPLVEVPADTFQVDRAERRIE